MVSLIFATIAALCMSGAIGATGTTDPASKMATPTPGAGFRRTTLTRTVVAAPHSKFGPKEATSVPLPPNLSPDAPQQVPTPVANGRTATAVRSGGFRPVTNTPTPVSFPHSPFAPVGHSATPTAHPAPKAHTATPAPVKTPARIPPWPSLFTRTAKPQPTGTPVPHAHPTNAPHVYISPTPVHSAPSSFGGIWWILLAVAVVGVVVGAGAGYYFYMRSADEPRDGYAEIDGGYGSTKVL